jgi:hypothetical protein
VALIALGASVELQVSIGGGAQLPLWAGGQRRCAFVRPPTMRRALGRMANGSITALARRPPNGHFTMQSEWRPAARHHICGRDLCSHKRGGGGNRPAAMKAAARRRQTAADMSRAGGRPNRASALISST